MTVPDRILGLDNADWPSWVQVLVGVALLVAVVAVSVVVIRGIAWLFFGDWMRAIATTAVLAVLVQTGVVSVDGTWSWVQGQLAADAPWLTVAAIALGAYPVWLFARSLAATWSRQLPAQGLRHPAGSAH